MSTTKTIVSPVLETAIQYLSLAAYFALLVLGLLYVFNGSFLLALLFSFIATAVLLGIIYLLQREKLSKEAKPNHFTENMLLALFMFIMIASYPVILHFFNISVTSKDFYQAIALQKLESIKDAKASYRNLVESDVATFKNKVDNAMQEYMINKDPRKLAELDTLLVSGTYQIGNIASVQAQRDQRASKIPVDLALGPIETKMDEFYNQSKNTFTTWNIGLVASYYYLIDEKISEYMKSAQNKKPQFSITPTSLPDLNFKNPFKSFKNATTSGYIITFFIFSCLFISIIFPYYNIKRKPVLKGSKTGKTITI